MSEDQEWSRRVLLAGLEIVYEPGAVVRHSHVYTLAAAFRRFFDPASAERAYVSEARESRAALRRTALAMRRRGRMAVAHGPATLAPVRGGLRARRSSPGSSSGAPRAAPGRAEAEDERAARGVEGPQRATRRRRTGGSSGLRVCLIYDHLFPETVGGAERWMRDLGLHLAGAGNDVTHVTMRHWLPDSPPDSTHVRVIGVTAAGRVYGDERRTLLPPVRFGAAVARHLWRHGSEYDVVHVASFPYSSSPPAHCGGAAATASS